MTSRDFAHAVGTLSEVCSAIDVYCIVLYSRSSRMYPLGHLYLYDILQPRRCRRAATTPRFAARTALRHMPSSVRSESMRANARATLQFEFSHKNLLANNVFSHSTFLHFSCAKFKFLNFARHIHTYVVSAVGRAHTRHTWRQFFNTFFIQLLFAHWRVSSSMPAVTGVMQKSCGN